MPAPSFEGEARYKARAASNALKDIVEDSLDELLRVWEARFAADLGPIHPLSDLLLELVSPLTLEVARGTRPAF